MDIIFLIYVIGGLISVGLMHTMFTYKCFSSSKDKASIKQYIISFVTSWYGPVLFVYGFLSVFINDIKDDNFSSKN